MALSAFWYYAYDDAGRLDSITHKRGSGDVLRSCGYQYDANGNITRITNHDNSYVDYEYDDWNRLTRETWKNAVGFTTLDIQYSYDNPVGDTGNIYQKIVSRNGGSPETTTFNYDAYNKLTSITHPDSSTETLTYDNNGQLTKRQKSGDNNPPETTTYQWNDQGFLTKVTLPSGEPVEYKYDGANRLVGRKNADGEDLFVQSGWNIVTDKDANDNRTYYIGASSINESEAKYFHFNHRGDTVIVTDAEGNILNNINYEAYGQLVDPVGNKLNSLSLPKIPNLFVGKHGIRYDRKTGLNYMRFRWMSSDLMRFISPDRLFNENRYSYVHNNPVILIDPLGLYEIESIIVFDQEGKPIEIKPDYRKRRAGRFWDKKGNYIPEKYRDFFNSQVTARKNPITLKDDRLKYGASANYTENCHGFALAGATGAFISAKDALKMLKSKSYIPMDPGTPLKEGDVVHYEGSHTATVVHVSGNTVWVIERDGDGGVYLTTLDGLIGAGLGIFDIYRPDPASPPILTVKAGWWTYKEPIHPYQLIKKYLDKYIDKCLKKLSKSPCK